MRRMREHFRLLVWLCPLALAGQPAWGGYGGLPFVPPIVPPFEPPPPGPPPPPPPPIPPTGALSSINPFVGMVSETWESRNNAFTPFFHYEPDPTPIMGGAAAFSGPFMAIYQPGLADFLLHAVPARTSDGTKGMGIDSSGTKVLVFESPMSDFGAFWGTGTPSNGATLTFYDAVGNPVDAPTSFTYTRNGSFTGGDGVLEWHGWRSTTPFRSVEIRGSFVAIDGLQAKPAGQLTLDNFNSGNGRFGSHPGFSGTSAGQNATSTSTRDTNVFMGDRGASMRLNIDDNPAVNAPDGTGWRVRFLSGVGTPANNANLEDPGWVGFWMKTTTANLRAALLIDDDLALERSTRLSVTADGQWHLYQWNLADANHWDPFAGTGPNGVIGANPVTIDSLYFDTTSIGPTDANALFWIDNVTWSPTQIVPEPGALGLVCMGGVGLLRRRRRTN